MNQTTITRFQNYLAEVINYYHQFGSLRGFSVLSDKHKTSPIPTEVFFQMGIDKMPKGSTPSLDICLEALQNIDRRRKASTQKLQDRIGELENLLDVATARNASLNQKIHSLNQEVDRLKKTSTKLKAPALFHVVLPDGLPFKHAFMSSSPVDDADIDKIQEAGISNSQQYKMAGNSIVACLYHLFRKMFTETQNEDRQLTLW